MSGKCPVGKVSCRENGLSGKCPVGKVSCRESVLSGKCLVGNVDVGNVSQSLMSRMNLTLNLQVFYRQK